MCNFKALQEAELQYWAVIEKKSTDSDLENTKN